MRSSFLRRAKSVSDRLLAYSSDQTWSSALDSFRERKRAIMRGRSGSSGVEPGIMSTWRGNSGTRSLPTMKSLFIFSSSWDPCSDRPQTTSFSANTVNCNHKVTLAARLPNRDRLLSLSVILVCVSHQYSFAAIWRIRGSSVLFTRPKVAGALTVAPGLRNCVWLKKLNHSNRN